jgi:hypothetical protein
MNLESGGNNANADKSLKNEHPSETLPGLELNRMLEKVKEESISRGPSFKPIIKNIYRKTLYAIHAYIACSMLFEVSKFKQAEPDYQNAKEMLEEYRIGGDTTGYTAKYEEAITLFGKNNLSFLEESQDSRTQLVEHYKEDFDYDRHFQILSLFSEGIPGPIFSEDFFENKYRDNYQKRQEEIKGIMDTYQTGDVSSGSTDITIETPITFKRPEDSNVDTLKKEHLEKIIAETYPKGWFTEEVRHILITADTTGSSMAHYGMKGSEGGHFSQKGGEIVLRAQIMKDDPQYTLSLIAHESAHANDWNSNENMSTVERLDLLLQVGQRLNDSDRFISSYVQKINSPNKAFEKYYKATEYWAEICEEYFMYGKKNLSPKDIRLVERIIKKKDQQFDADRAIAKRIQILQEEVYKKPRGSFSPEEQLIYKKTSDAIDEDSHNRNMKFSFLREHFEDLDSIAKSAGFPSMYEVMMKAQEQDKELSDILQIRNHGTIIDTFTTLCSLSCKAEKTLNEIKDEYRKRTGVYFQLDLKSLYEY